MMCERCGRREATHWLTVETLQKAQCRLCADAGADMAEAFGLLYSVEPIKVDRL